MLRVAPASEITLYDFLVDVRGTKKIEIGTW
jgi:hypothetical protein